MRRLPEQSGLTSAHSSRNGKPGNVVLVFDPSTYAYLGTSDGDAVLDTEIVAKVGQQP
jgi:hypothetical protein